MYASLKGHVEVVDKLLQHGATVDLQDKVSIALFLNVSDHMRNMSTQCKSTISLSGLAWHDMYSC